MFMHIYGITLLKSIKNKSAQLNYVKAALCGRKQWKNKLGVIGSKWVKQEAHWQQRIQLDKGVSSSSRQQSSKNQTSLQGTYRFLIGKLVICIWVKISFHVLCNDTVYKVNFKFSFKFHILH